MDFLFEKLLINMFNKFMTFFLEFNIPPVNTDIGQHDHKAIGSHFSRFSCGIFLREHH